MQTRSLVWLAAAAVVQVLPAAAHGGGLNAEGCHNNRKTGDYHCHRSPPPPPPPASSFEATGPARNGASSFREQTESDGSAFANCTAARAAGAAPVRAGDPGYGAHLDRDGDGVGCE